MDRRAMAFCREPAHRGVRGQAKRNSQAGRSQDAPGLRHARMLMALITMQNTLAGMKPNWSVLKPMMQTRTLLTPANAQPSQHRRPTRIVDATVSTQER